MGHDVAPSCCSACIGSTSDVLALAHDDGRFLCRFHNPFSSLNYDPWTMSDDNRIGTRDELVDKFIDHDDVDVEKGDVDELVDAKIDEYEGLVSPPAAVFLAAREFGHDLNDLFGDDFNPTHYDVERMLNAELRTDDDGNEWGPNGISGTYKIRRCSVDVNNGGGSWSKRADLVVFDETGEIEMTLWDDMADAVERLESGDEVQIDQGYVKGSDYSDTASRGLNIGKKGCLTLPDDTKVTGPEYEDED